jgi:hypothetical protein
MMMFATAAVACSLGLNSGGPAIGCSLSVHLHRNLAQVVSVPDKLYVSERA